MFKCSDYCLKLVYDNLIYSYFLKKRTSFSPRSIGATDWASYYAVARQ